MPATAAKPKSPSCTARNLNPARARNHSVWRFLKGPSHSPGIRFHRAFLKIRLRDLERPHSIDGEEPCRPAVALRLRTRQESQKEADPAAGIVSCIVEGHKSTYIPVFCDCIGPLCLEVVIPSHAGSFRIRWVALRCLKNRVQREEGRGVLLKCLQAKTAGCTVMEAGAVMSIEG